MSSSLCSAPPRRKSCAECIKAKRRCDLQRPRCLRCSKQDINCDYGPAWQPKRKRIIDIAGPQRSPELNSPGPFDNTETILQDLVSGPESLEDLLELPVDVQDFLNTAMVSPITEKTDLQLHRPAHLVMEPLTFDNLNSVIERRMSYAIEQLKLVPQRFAERGRSPWSHPVLYETEMPAVMREVQAACALYTVKNETNAKSIWRNIEGRAEQLFLSERPTERTALLAYTQAMLLYQLMRGFGGDFAERAKVDASMQQLEDAAYALYSSADLVADSSAPLALYPTAESSAFWHSWILAESQRRTYLACFMFMSIWSLFNARIGYCGQHAALLSVWTASAHLWEAKSLFDFTLAWQGKQHFVVRELDFTRIIAEAKADDVELFGKILLSGTMGVDDFKGWLYTRGGKLSDLP